MSNRQSRKKPGVMMRYWIVLLMLLMSTQCLAASTPNPYKPHNGPKKDFIEQMKNGFLSFRLENVGELQHALSSLRKGELELALDYVWTLSMYSFLESDKVLAFVEDELPDAIESTEHRCKAFEFLEYYLDITVWDLWKQYNFLDTTEKEQVMAALNAVKDYRQIYPRKTEATLAKDLKTLFPGELNSGIDYTAQARQILSGVSPANASDELK